MAKLSGRGALLRKLESLPAVVRAATQPAVEKAAAELVQRMQARAPKKSGKLRASIRAIPRAEGMAQRVVAGGRATQVEIRKGSGQIWDYALGVEFGVRGHEAGGLFDGAEHPGQSATPFFYPTYRAAKRSTKSRISRAMGKGVKQAAGKS